MEKQSGKVKFYNQLKGFGFIVPDSNNGNGKDMFFHKSGISEGYEPKPDDNVSYITFDGRKGVEAVDVDFES